MGLICFVFCLCFFNFCFLINILQYQKKRVNKMDSAKYTHTVTADLISAI